MKKIICTFILIIISLFAVFGLNAASGEGIIAEKTDFFYTVSDNSVRIDEYVGGYLNIIIPDTIEGYPVTEISSYAFCDCAAITEIKIPEGVTSIGVNAFESCKSLDKITLPGSLNRVSCSAFDGCNNLKNIIFNTKNSCDSGFLSKVESYEDGSVLFRCAKCGRELKYMPGIDLNHDLVITIGTVYASAGDEVEVPVYISGNPGIYSTIFFDFDYDKNALSLDKIICGNDDLYKCLYIKNYVATSKIREDVSEDGLFFIMRFTVSPDAKDGIYSINLNYDICNHDEEEIVFYVNYGYICISPSNETDTNTGSVTDKPKPIETDPVTDKPIDTEPDTKSDENLIGDINGDGKVNSKDLTRLMKIIAGVSGESAENVDINGDGKVNSKDLTRLMKMIAGDTAA